MTNNKIWKHTESTSKAVVTLPPILTPCTPNNLIMGQNRNHISGRGRGPGRGRGRHSSTVFVLFWFFFCCFCRVFRVSARGINALQVRFCFLLNALLARYLLIKHLKFYTPRNQATFHNPFQLLPRPVHKPFVGVARTDKPLVLTNGNMPARFYSGWDKLECIKKFPAN